MEYQERQVKSGSFTSEMADYHIPDVDEEVLTTVNITT